MIRFTQRELDAILGEFLGKPYKRFASGPDAYDCYGLVKAFMARIGVDIPEIGAVNPNDSRPIYEQQQTDYVRIEWPRPWSLVTFSGKDLNAHIGVVLPNDNLFLHCPGRAAGRVLAEPLSRRPWRDTIDGYWWPKSVLESIIMLTPMTTKRAWQFVKCDGRSLGEIIEQDITDGRDVQVQAFIDGQLVEVDDWTMIPSPVNQLVVRPVVGEGDQMGMMAGMVALAMLAPYIAGPLAGVSSGAATAAGGYGAAAWAAGGSTAFAYGLANAAVMMGGALALNALIGPGEGAKDASQHYAWDPQTTQRVGSFVPLVYGTFGVKGSIIAAYATGEYTTQAQTLLKGLYVRSAKDLYHLKIAYSDGPIGGVVDGTEQLNGKAAEQYDDSDDFVIEHFVGNSDQAASSVLDGFEISVNKLCYDTAVSPNEVTKTFTAVKCDRAAAVLRFPNGFTNYTADGDSGTTSVDVTFRIRPSGGSWHTIFDGEIHGKTKNPVRLHLWFDGTYDGASGPFTKTSGTAFTLVAGTTYEVGVTRNNSRHSDRGDDFYFDCIQCSFTTAQKHPGLAYTAIGAAASKDISGAIDYYAQIKGKLVRVYDPDEEEWNIEWSDNPAWVAYDLLTRPVIKGNGDTEAYSVDYYRRLDPSYLILADFVALADWCDELVPDESGEPGSTEKRYVFNGVFDTEGTAWDQAVRVCRMACAMLHFRGHKIGIVIDKPGTPVQMFNVSNLRGGFSETWIDTREVATVYDCEFYDETGDYSAESWPVPLLGAANDVPAALDCFGHTKRSRVWRYASRQLRVNQYMKRFIEIPASLDAIYTDLGDIVYVQHPSLQRASGGRVVEVYADGVKLDKSVEMGEGDYALLIRTHDGTDERLTLYAVDSVTGVESGDNDIVVIDGTWEYTPNVNDLWTFGEEVKVIDLYRVKGFARGGDGQVLIQASQYSTDYYADDEEAPTIEAKTYSETKGGIAPSLLPTTAQAVAADRADVDDVVDTLMWEGLAFTGDAINTVTWECTGDGVKYKGQWCPIEDDAVGTTDKYIYFDPAIGDPRYLQTTNDLSDLAGFERYVFCVNDGGVAYFKPGVLMTSDDVKLYNIEEGATAGATWGVNIINQPDMVFQTLFQDLDPSGANTGVTEDGTMHTSDGFGLVIDVKREYGVHLGECKVYSDGAQTINVRIQAWSAGATGDVLYNESFVCVDGENTIDLDVDLDEGTYIIYRNGTHGLKRISSGFDYDASGSPLDWDTFQIVTGADTGGTTYASAYYYFFELTVSNIDLEVGWFWVNADRELRSWNGTSWVLIEDPGVQMALDAAADAQATADGKIKTFVQASEPTAESTGDLWLDSDDGYKMYRWSGSAWIDVRDTGITSAISAAATAQSTADGKVTTFYAASPPTAEAEGDLWIDTDDSNRLYRWSGSAWVDVQDGDIAEAVARAGTASAIASDGKIVSHYSTAPPLVAHWKLNDNADSTVVADSSGNGHHGTASGVILRSNGSVVTGDYRGNSLSNRGVAFVCSGETRFGKCIIDVNSPRTLRINASVFIAGTGVVGDPLYSKLYDLVSGPNEIDLDMVFPTNDPGEQYALWLPSGGTGVNVGIRVNSTLGSGGFAGLLGDTVVFSGYCIANTGVIDTTYYWFFGLQTNQSLGYTSGMSVPGKIGTGLEFITARSRYISVPHHADLNIGAGSGGTICFWVKWDGTRVATGGYNPRLFTKGSMNVYHNVSGAIVFQNPTATTSIVGVLVPGVWRHIALVLDPTAGTRTFYVDGIEATASGREGAMPNTATGVVYLGSYTTTGGYFGGQVDDTRIYSRPLTRGEILRIYNEGHGTENVVIPDVGDLWIKTDEDNKPYRWSGAAWVDADYDVATWSKIVGDGKPSNNADVTADNPVEAFRETFENPNNDVAMRWLPDGTYDRGEVSTVAGGIVGGKVLQCGNNSDNDHVFRYFYRPIPFDPEKLYRIRARVRRVEGGGSFYLGVGGMDETKTTFVRYNGDNLDAGHHWVASQEAYPTDWTVYTGYVKGHADVGVNGNNSPHPDPSDPAKLHADVCYIHPVFQANNPYKTGIYEIDYIVIDTIPEEASWESVYGSGKPEDNADVTATHATSILFHSDTEPTSPQEGWTWWDTSGDPVLIKRYDGSEWVTVGVDIQHWLHGVDPTKLDGSHLYPSSVDTDALKANSVTAAKMLVEMLSAITQYVGTLVGGSITGSEIVGGIIRTATSGRYVQIDEEGIKFFMVATAGLYGTTGSGGSNLVYGTSGSGGSGAIYGNGVLARFYNMGSGIPFDIVSEQATVGDLHLFPRSSDPTTGKRGDIALVNNKLRVCTSTTPTWQDL